MRLAAWLVGARCMSIVTLVVAVRFVKIEAFAEFGIYQTVATLAGIALFLRYDAAIAAARSREEAGEALRLCVAVGSVLWLAVAAMSLAGGGLGVPRLSLALLLPLSVLARGILRLLFVSATREGDMEGIGRASMAQSVAQPAILVVLVLSSIEDATCFAIADVSGHAVGVAYLCWRGRRGLGALRRGWSAGALAAAGRKWRGLPLYNLPSSFLALAFVMSPLLIAPMTAGAVFAGHVALAYRMFDVPTQIVAAASTPVFLNRLRPSGGSATPVFRRRIMLGLVLFIGSTYALLTGLLFLADPVLEGSALAGLSEVVPAIALFHLFVALGAPIHDSCALYPQQRRLVPIQGAALLGALLAAVLAVRASPESALYGLAAASAFRTIALGELLRALSRLNGRGFAAIPIRPEYPVP